MIVLAAFHVDVPCFKTGTYTWTDGQRQCEGHFLVNFEANNKTDPAKTIKGEVKRKKTIHNLELNSVVIGECFCNFS